MDKMIQSHSLNGLIALEAKELALLIIQLQQQKIITTC